MTQRHILTGAGGSLANLVMAMAADAARNQADEAKQGVNVPSSEIPHQVQPDYVDSDKDFDAKGFEDFMTHLFGDAREMPSDYYDGQQYTGYAPDFVLVDDDDDDDFDDVFTGYDDDQRNVHVYIENVNINIVVERD